MKTAIKTILIIIALLVSAGQAFAYPPDNAAVLYYKAFMLLEEPNDSVKQMLRDLMDGKIGLNEQIRRYVERNRIVLRDVITAGEIKNCDWGLDFSEWLDSGIPHLVKCRQLLYILAADVKILCEEGDYKTAIDRCFTIHRMGGQVGNDTIVQGLVGNAIGVLANKCIVGILPEISGDSETLEGLKTRLINISSRNVSIKTAMANEAELIGQQIMNRERVLSFISEEMGLKKELPKEVLEGDDEFFVRSGEYFQNTMAKIQSAFDLPYPESLQKVEELAQQVSKDVNEKPEAVVTKYLLTPNCKIVSLDTRDKTQLNAVIAATDIYLIRAKTGKLPDEMPVGLPKDMFSRKDFLYEKTDAGFILKCQGKDLSKDIVHQYEFKVTK